MVPGHSTAQGGPFMSESFGACGQVIRNWKAPQSLEAVLLVFRFLRSWSWLHFPISWEYSVIANQDGFTSCPRQVAKPSA